VTLASNELNFKDRSALFDNGTGLVFLLRHGTVSGVSVQLQSAGEP
jgi:hypothetical protein